MHGCDVINNPNDDMICTNMVVIGRGAKQDSVSSFEDHGLQNLPFYASQDLLAYAIAGLVKFSKVLTIAIMHEYVYLGKDKTFHSSASYKKIVTIKSMTVCPSLPYVIVMIDTEVDRGSYVSR